MTRKIGVFFSFCLIFSILSGCAPIGQLTKNDPGLSFNKTKEGYQISGKTTVTTSSVTYFWPINVSKNKSISIFCKLLVRKGFSDSNNITIGFYSDEGNSYSFGPRNSAYHAINDQKQIYDLKNAKPLFGDESQKFHEITVNYDSRDKYFRGYVDGILFGELDSKKIDINTGNFLTSAFFGYNTVGKDVDVDVVFKDFKIIKK